MNKEKILKKIDTQNFNPNLQGFNYLEIIFSATVIGILMVLLITLLTPNELFTSVNSSQRENDIRELDDAFDHYALENQSQASEIAALKNNQPYMVINSVSAYNSPLTCLSVLGKVNTTTINSLVPNYLPTVPIDPSVIDSGTEGSGYYVLRKATQVRTGSCNNGYDFANGLVGLWHMDESIWDGSNKAMDATSNDNNLSKTGSVEVTSANVKVGDYAGNFNAVTESYLSKASPTGLPTGTAARTIAVWAYFNAACNCVMGGYGTAADGKNFQLSVTTGNYIVYGWGGGYDWGTGIAASGYTGAWHYYAVTYDGTTTRFYIDGQQKAQTTSFTWNTIPSYIVIGNEIDFNTKQFLGQLDEFAIWDRVLSDGEIMALYNLQQ